jgi:hypothetical protein
MTVLAEAEGRRYRAFISYSGRDRRTGERFQAELERYKVPRPLVGRETGSGVVTRRLSPIFRDRWDLSASDDLGGSLKSALLASDALIVLCSPSSASSMWVNAEIDEFRRLGREHRIIAVLIDGAPEIHDPDANPNGAFPPALVRRPDGSVVEPFAPDIREPDGDPPGDGFEFAKLKVISSLIGVPLTELTQRQHEADRRERTRNRRIAGAMSALALFATIGGALAWTRNLDAQQRFGDAVGIAADRVVDAAQLKETYNVPQSVIIDMLNRTRASIEEIGGGKDASGLVRLQRARLSLRLLEAYGVLLTSPPEEGDVGEETLLDDSDALLADAGQALDQLERSGVNAICGGANPVCDMLRTLVAAPSPHDVRVERIRYWDAAGNAALDRGDRDAALTAFQNTIDLSGLPGRDGAIDYSELAISYERMADARYELDGLDSAEAAFRANLETWRKHRAGMGKDAPPKEIAQVSHGLFAAQMRLADILAQQGRGPEALAMIQSALIEAEAAAAASSANREFAMALFIGYGEYADRLKESGDDAGAHDASRKAVDGMARIVANAPDRADFALTYATRLYRLADFDLDAGDFSNAREHLRTSAVLFTDALARDPGDIDTTLELSRVEVRTATLGLIEAEADPGLATANCADAAPLLDAALDRRRRVLEQMPDDDVALNEVQDALRVRSLASLRCGGPPALAAADLQEAISLKARQIGDAADNPYQLKDLYLLHAALGAAYAEAGDMRARRRELETVITLARRAQDAARTGGDDALADDIAGALAEAKEDLDVQ